MNKEANNTRHPLRRSPNNTVVDTAPKTETGFSLAQTVVEWSRGGNAATSNVQLVPACEFRFLPGL